VQPRPNDKGSETVAKVIVQHDEDPAIGMILETVEAGTSGRARGTHGTCTECGWPMHRWDRERAIEDAQAHVDRHESSL
jgi:hypothetical protein